MVIYACKKKKKAERGLIPAVLTARIILHLLFLAPPTLSSWHGFKTHLSRNHPPPSPFEFCLSHFDLFISCSFITFRSCRHLDEKHSVFGR